MCMKIRQLAKLCKNAKVVKFAIVTIFKCNPRDLLI